MRFWPAVIIDILAIVVFALVGRANHAEGVHLLGLAQTAWPFLAGWLLGAVAARLWRRPGALSTGVVVWTATVVVGMLLRTLTGAGVELSFVIVTAIVLGAFLIGWRAARRLITSRATPSPRLQDR